MRRRTGARRAAGHGGRPRARALPLSGALLVGLLGCTPTPDLSSPLVQQGFRHTGGYTESGTATPARLVDRVVNEGAAARSATFVVVLKEEDGRTVWTGSATVRDVAAGEEVVVVYTSDQPLPDGDQFQLWHVADVVR